MDPTMTQEELIREQPVLSVLEEVEHHNLCVKYIEQFEENVSLKNENEILSDSDLRRMMRDPKYWRDGDTEYIRKIENGFKKLYS